MTFEFWRNVIFLGVASLVTGFLLSGALGEFLITLWGQLRKKEER